MKYFIGYDDGRKVRPISVMLPKMHTFRRNFDELKYISFVIKNDELLKSYYEIWDKVSKVVKKEFDS